MPNRDDTHVKTRILHAKVSGQHKLDLSHRGLRNLPPEIGLLSDLRDLDLSGNQLKTLPVSIGKLTALQSLDLSRNQFRLLPPAICNLVSLLFLDLSRNQLHRLPPAIGKLTQLQRLYLIGNKLDALPQTIGQWTLLQRLNLSRNQFATLPDEIAGLRSLLNLHVNQNQLSQIPAAIGALTALRGLDLALNELVALPQEIVALHGLEKARTIEPLEGSGCIYGLLLEGNPLPDPYPRLIKPGGVAAARHVFSWLRGALDAEALLRLQDARGALDAEALLRLQDEPPDVVAGDGDAKQDSDRAAVPLAKLEQRPAAYRFGLRQGKIDALPEPAAPLDAAIAAELHAELVAKTEHLQARLSTSNAGLRAKHSIEALMQALAGPLQGLRPGILLSKSRSLEADRNAFDSQEGRRQLFPGAIAMIDDVLLSLRDLLALYPIIRAIEGERLALDLQRQAKRLDAVAAAIRSIADQAARSEVVAPGAIVALGANEASIAAAEAVELRAGLLADTLLVFRNFSAAVIQSAPPRSRKAAVDSAAKPRTLRSELGELGQRSWQAVKERLPDGIGAAASIVPLAAIAVLAADLAGPLASLAPLVASFKSLAEAAKALQGHRPRPEGGGEPPPRSRANPNRRGRTQA